ncbi:hypothetical protein, partial [Pseudomonas viridiflava]|uniref:hypothetical protein n=1 Tax=Pseudomonas viridiflava TaxID=33069 RepID=UPI00197B4362
MDKLQRYPRHALGPLNPQSVPFVTRSVTGCITTQSVVTITDLQHTDRAHRSALIVMHKSAATLIVPIAPRGH